MRLFSYREKLWYIHSLWLISTEFWHKFSLILYLDRTLRALQPFNTINFTVKKTDIEVSPSASSII